MVHRDEDDEQCMGIRRDLLQIVTEIEKVLINPEAAVDGAWEALRLVPYPDPNQGNPIAEALAAELTAARQALEVLADEQGHYRGPATIGERDLKVIHRLANLKAGLGSS